jgi:glucokinase
MTGMAGELGHITVDPYGVQCGCGNRGCLEQYASATAVMRMANEAVARGEAPRFTKAMNQDPQFSAKAIYQMAAEKDPVALRIFSNVGQALGIALANMINVLNLPMYVIGGGMANAWDVFAPALLYQVQRRSFVYNATAPSAEEFQLEKTDANNAYIRQSTIVARASLGSDAGLLGAARLPMIASTDLSRPVPKHASAEVGSGH